jgi:hypothetical protein
MHCEGKLKLRSHNTSYCLIEVVTKAGWTVSHVRNKQSYLESRLLLDKIQMENLQIVDKYKVKSILQFCQQLII